MALKIQRAEESDNEALNYLFRSTPQKGPVELVLEREPSFFSASGLLASDSSLWLVRDSSMPDANKNVVGFLSMGSRYVYLNGKAKKVRYASDLRIHPNYRNGTILVRMYRHVKKEIDDYNELAQTVILDDNTMSKDSITMGRGGLPKYFPQGVLNSYYINNGKTCCPRYNYKIRRATALDTRAMQVFFDNEAKKYQGYPVYDFSKIIAGDHYYLGQSIEDYVLAFDDGRIVGLMGVWNQSDIKQLRFNKYTGFYKWLKPFANIFYSIKRAQKLPNKGEVLKYQCIHCVLVKNNKKEIFDDILAFVVYEYCNRGESLMLGLMEGESLNQSLKKYSSRKTKSCHYLVSWGEDPRPGLDKSLPWYVETARL